MNDFNIPNTWAEIEFKKIFSAIKGKKPKELFEFKEEGTVPYVNIKAFSGNGIDSYAYPESSRIVEEGDVVIVWDGSRSGLVGKSIYGALGSTLGKFVKNKYLNNEFFYLFLHSKYDELNSNTKGAGIPHLNPDFLGNYSYPIPPLSEQERIVEKIESCFEKIDETESSLNKVEKLLEKYRESLLAKAFRGELIPQNENDEAAIVLLEKIRAEREKSAPAKKKKVQAFAPITDDEKPFDIPESWEWARISDLFNVMTGATPLKSNKSYYDKKEVAYIKTGDVQNCLIYEANEFISNQAIEETNVKVFPIDTLLVAMYGEGKTRGQVGILKIQAGTNQACAALVNTSLDYSVREYVFNWFLVQYEDLRKKAEGGNQANLNLQKIKDVVIPIPPMNEMEEISKKVKSLSDFVQSILDDVDKKVTLSKSLRESVLSSAFEGRLVEQIESEGTGKELLEKILKAKAEEAPKKKVTKKKIAKKSVKKKTTKKK